MFWPHCLMFQGKLSMESEREQCAASDASVVPSLSLWHWEQSVVVQEDAAVSLVREEVNFPSKSRGADRAGVALSPLLSLPGAPQSIFVTASPVHCH